MPLMNDLIVALSAAIRLQGKDFFFFQESK